MIKHVSLPCYLFLSLFLIWFWFLHQELFAGSKYKFKNENDVYQLIINNPKVEDAGKYTIEIGGIVSTAFLNVDGKYTVNHSIFYFMYNQGHESVFSLG